MRACKAFLLSACLLTGIHSGARPDFYLRDGDTVVFYGDSITDQRFYTTFVECYVLTRFPRRKIHFINVGWSGDRVSGGGGGPVDVRIQRDILARHPTVLTILLGMNDGEYHPWSPEVFDKYAAGYRHIVDTVRAQAPDLRITLLEPTPYDDVTRPPEFPGGYNAVMVRYGRFVRDLARSGRLGVADLNAPVNSVLACADKLDPPLARHMISDRVHPSQGVHWVMAEAILKAWNAPSIVTAVEIDAAAGAVRRAENTQVDALDTAAGVSWTQLDRALPAPIEREQDSIGMALRCADVIDALNRQPLKVTGLDPGRYTLKIDDETAGAFTADELAQGINLATLPTPMASQSAELRLLTFRRNHVQYAEWRYLDVSLRDYRLSKLDPAVAALDALDAELVALQNAAAQPKPHRYRLIAATR